MSTPEPVWQCSPNPNVPAAFVQAVSQYTPESSGKFAAQVLWQRGIRTVKQLVPFVNPTAYEPTSPFAFGQEMDWAIARLIAAFESAEHVAIWGDFDADGVTATSVLWEGLGQFFPAGDRLTYVIPNRLTESHGLSRRGLDTLAAQGVTLIVTCDTGSTNLAELDYAITLGMEVIVTDHHTLPPQRPNVVAIINPRSLPANHPLAHLSGVAVAYKLVEALYETLPEVPQRPLAHLLDLVAIGLIADLVELRGDCRYLAQVGIQRLQTQVKTPTRPGIASLLTYCRRSGDRPTDISFGIGPRINAISRIYGDAHFCVDLLTSTDAEQCRKLAEDTEMANLRRKALQRDVVNQVTLRLAELDLSTMGVIVLADSQWPVGVLGLVAGQIAQDHGRPTILLNRADPPLSHQGGGNVDTGSNTTSSVVPLARGSARSVNNIDLYDLVHSQSHLLLSFGGHPYAAGLSLRADDVQLFADAINQEFRSRYGSAIAHSQIIQTDLIVQVADLGRPLFRELSLLEPCGMGNPIPRLLIQNCWFKAVWNRKIQDLQNRKLNYIKTTFELWDDSVKQGFPGTWWGHYKEDVPEGRCDAIFELDYNSSPKGKRSAQYEVRLIAVRPAQAASPYAVVMRGYQDHQPQGNHLLLLDWRSKVPHAHPESASLSSDVSSSDVSSSDVPSSDVPSAGAHASDAHASDAHEVALRPPVAVDDCPATWQGFYDGLTQAQSENTSLAIAFPPPTEHTPVELWRRLVGIAKYLSRTQQSTSTEELQEILGIGGRSLQVGLSALKALRFNLSISGQHLTITASTNQPTQSEAAAKLSVDNESPDTLSMVQTFIDAVSEEHFRQQFFHEVPTSTLQMAADQFLKTPNS